MCTLHMCDCDVKLHMCCTDFSRTCMALTKHLHARIYFPSFPASRLTTNTSSTANSTSANSYLDALEFVFTTGQLPTRRLPKLSPSPMPGGVGNSAAADSHAGSGSDRKALLVNILVPALVCGTGGIVGAIAIILSCRRRAQVGRISPVTSSFKGVRSFGRSGECITSIYHIPYRNQGMHVLFAFVASSTC
jgi:hypothetical protein